eukprot:Protomagalhaensia_wolfi_Nauph_80__2417@NODE_2599_length_1042_cov_911_910269_g2034_i0_p1_GENE_NODE_2599_length_1042_cov_911_910269_g2034_i0NODE_2599_length_1042_cov_911_910269_g2034_i0_p1_ORF_typecomplete_len246_score29_36_NODE_2599_length_1042_cov_911_910269_g2034_i092829
MKVIVFEGKNTIPIASWSGLSALVEAFLPPAIVALTPEGVPMSELRDTEQWDSLRLWLEGFVTEKRIYLIPGKNMMFLSSPENKQYVVLTWLDPAVRRKPIMISWKAPETEELSAGTYRKLSQACITERKDSALSFEAASEWLASTDLGQSPESTIQDMAPSSTAHFGFFQTVYPGYTKKKKPRWSKLLNCFTSKPKIKSFEILNHEVLGPLSGITITHLSNIKSTAVKKFLKIRSSRKFKCPKF